MTYSYFRTAGLAVLGIGATVAIISTTAQSQVGPPKSVVALQPSLPGTSQSGHANISGKLTSGQIATGAGHFTNNTTFGPTYVSIFGSARLMVGSLASTGYEGLYALSGTTGRPFLGMGTPSASAWMYLDGGDGNKVKFYNGGDRVTIDPNGNVGIGTTSPQNRFTLVQSLTSQQGIAHIQNGTDFVPANPGRNGLTLSVAGSGNYAAGISSYVTSTTSTAYGLYTTTVATGNLQNAYSVYGDAAFGSNGSYAGYFNGNLFGVNLTATTKSFLIDHPLDPENKLLEHSSIESDQRMNLYRGEVRTDAKGFAWVTVPNWFSALNKNFQYQLTVIANDGEADFIQAMVTHRLDDDNRFQIRTSRGGVTVDWLLTGERHDPASNIHPLQVEQVKNAAQRGRYLVPEAYGLDRSYAMHRPPGMTEAGVAGR